MTYPVSKHQWSLQWAWRNSAWATRRGRNGEIVSFHPGRVLLAVARTINATLSPATVIYQHPEHLTARIVNLSTARRTVAAAAAIALASGAAALASSTPLIYFAAAGVVALSIVVCVGTTSDLAAARRTRPETDTHPAATHLMIDLVRAPNSSKGHAGEFVASIREAQHGTIVGTAPNHNVWTSVYESQADAVNTTDDGKTHFVLRRHI